MDLTLICHSHKMLDREVIELFCQNSKANLKLIDLAKDVISRKLLTMLAKKMDGWQFILVDTKFMDHSIKDPEKEFSILSSSAKIDFLYNNPWTIGTPIAVSEHTAARFMNVKDVEHWLKADHVLVEELL